MTPNRRRVGSLKPVLALILMEWRIGSRTAAFRLAVAAALVFGISVGAEPGRGVALSAYATAEAACLYLVFAGIVWMSLAAVRETILRTDILVFPKPQSGEVLALCKFLGAFFQLLVILFFVFAGSVLSRAFSGGLLGVEAYAIEYVRSAGVIFFAAAASYMMALLFDSALAGCTIGLFWLMTLSGKAFLAKYYFPTYSQNVAAYVALGASLLLTTLYFYRRSRRGSARPAVWVRIGAPTLALLAAWLFWVVIRDGHDPEARLNPLMERMTDQDTFVGHRTAGFLLPDQNGRLTKLSDFDGDILVIALWSPRDPDSVLLLDRLNEIQSALGNRGVQSIAITICEDNGASLAFARGERLRYPVVADWGTYNAPRGTEISPLASAYRVTSLPTVVVTDRRRKVTAILNGIDSYDGDNLSRLIQDRLADEPR